MNLQVKMEALKVAQQLIGPSNRDVELLITYARHLESYLAEHPPKHPGFEPAKVDKRYTPTLSEQLASKTPEANPTPPSFRLGEERHNADGSRDIWSENGWLQVEPPIPSGINPRAHGGK